MNDEATDRDTSHSQTMQKTYIRTCFDNLSALPPKYEQLFAHASRTSFFLSLPWFRNFVEAILGQNERLRIFTVDGASTSHAPHGLLLMREPSSRVTFPNAKILSGVANYYSSLFGPVIEADAQETQALLDALAVAITNGKNRWDIIDLHPLAVDDAVFPGLVAAFRNAGLFVQTYFCFGNWYLPIGKQTFKEYIAGRPSRISKTGMRKRRSLEASGRFRFELFTKVEELERAFTDYNTVYNSSWKIPEPYPQFISGMLRTCAEQGWLRLGIGYVDGAPAAAQIWTVVGGRASIYKLAYDERFAKLSVGTALTLILMEHVIDVDRVHEVDYLTGDDPYKKDWMSDRRERWGIVAFNLRTPMGFLAAMRHLGGRAARRVVKSLRPNRLTKG